MQIRIGAVLGLGARVPQIIINWQRGNTGDLHPAAFLFNSVANAVKLGCIFVLKGDRYMMAICLWMVRNRCYFSLASVPRCLAIDVATSVITGTWIPGD